MGSRRSGGGRRTDRDPDRGRRHDAPHVRHRAVPGRDRPQVPEPVDRGPPGYPVPRQHPLPAERRGVGQHLLHLHQTRGFRGSYQGILLCLLSLLL